MELHNSVVCLMKVASREETEQQGTLLVGPVFISGLASRGSLSRDIFDPVRPWPELTETGKRVLMWRNDSSRHYETNEFSVKDNTNLNICSWRNSRSVVEARLTLLWVCERGSIGWRTNRTQELRTRIPRGQKWHIFLSFQNLLLWLRITVTI